MYTSELISWLVNRIVMDGDHYIKGFTLRYIPIPGPNPELELDLEYGDNDDE